MGEADHVHLLFSYYPQMQLSKFINSLKSYTSQTIRKEFPCEVKRVYWDERFAEELFPRKLSRKPVFWTSSYFIASCGGVTVEVLKRYVQEQGKSVESTRSLSGSGARCP